MNPPLRPDGLAAVIATFGDPRPFVNEKEIWEANALVTVPLPIRLIYAYDVTKSVGRVRAHRSLAEHLAETLVACLRAGVPLHRLKYGGCYQWRSKRTSSELSLHTWGIAVDIEPAENPLGDEWKDDGTRLDLRVIATFKSFGWFWGGDFSRTKDPQHFQWATGV
jgi:hypothetical protein